MAGSAPRAHARNTDPDTSHLAADSLDAARLRRSQEEVFAIVQTLGAACDGEIATEAYARGSAQSPSGLRTRRAELVALGRVIDSGRRAITPSGRRTIVWAAAGDDGAARRAVVA